MRTEGQTEKQTDMTKLIVDFHNFVKVPKSLATSGRRLLLVPAYVRVSPPARLHYLSSSVYIVCVT